MEPELLKELMVQFMLSKEMTKIVEHELIKVKRKTKSKPTTQRKTNSKPTNPVLRMFPFNVEDEMASNYGMIPLVTLGQIHGNLNMGRISVQEWDPTVLYVHFRPLNIEFIDQILKNTKWMNMIMKYFRFKELQLTSEYTLDHLIYLVRMMDRENGYEKELKREGYSAYLENDFKSVANKIVRKEKRFEPFLRAFPEIYRSSPGTKLESNVSLFNYLTQFIHLYKPTKVVFAGYSLGSGMALNASYWVHRSLPNPPKMIVYQFAGPKAGTLEMKHYIDTHFEKCVYVSVSKNGYLDLVSRIHKKPWVHIGQLYDIDLATHQVKAIPYSEKYGKYKMSMTSLVVGFILKRPSAEPFQSIHNAAENVIGRMLLSHLVNQKVSLLPYITDGPECDYFSQGYSGKYEVCPEIKCEIESTVVNQKKQVKCVEKIVLVPPPSTLAKTKKTNRSVSIPPVMLPSPPSPSTIIENTPKPSRIILPPLIRLPPLRKA